MVLVPLSFSPFVLKLEVVPRYSSITASLIPRSLPRKELFPELLESVIPERFYRKSRRGRNWNPDQNIRG